MVVFADSKKDWGALPPGAAGLRSEGGGTIPMVFVTSADGSEGIQAIPYSALRDDIREADRDLRKKLETVDVLGSSATADGPSTGSTPPAAPLGFDTKTDSGEAILSPSQAWTNVEGKEITAAVRKVNGDLVEFIMPNGQSVSYPLANLSDESRRRISELAAP